MVHGSAASALRHIQLGSNEWRSDHDLAARRDARLDDPIVPPVTWSDYVQALMKRFAPADSLMQLVRQITPLNMEPGISTDQLAMPVHDTYRCFHAEAKHT